MDTANRRLTYGVGIGVFIAIPLILSITFWTTFNDKNIILMPITFGLIFLAISLFRVIRYELTDDTLRVCRMIGGVTIPLADIVSVNDDMSGIDGFTVRLFGSSGIFGSQGIFWNKKLGRFRAYVMNRANTVQLTTRAGKHIFVSPDPKEEFVDIINGLINK